eukprot:TRINITY_DN10897_c0_g1_i1.p1 TRINITY_DN10897_c0_g1~~TRINITY_DN10897_c0_g1_i1.p1  ORF type:complete len:253 (-),score=136.77 TRINITY_DN10897_c0_g1_i1:649-1407(-)
MEPGEMKTTVDERQRKREEELRKIQVLKHRLASLTAETSATDTSKVDKAELEELVRKCENLMTITKRSIETIEAKWETESVQGQQLRQRIVALESASGAPSSLLDELQAKNAELTKALAASRESVQNFEQQVEQLTHERDVFERRTKNLEQKILQANEEATRRAVEQSRKLFETSSSSGDPSRKEINEFRQRIEDQELTIEDLKRQKETLEEQLKDTSQKSSSSSLSVPSSPLLTGASPFETDDLRLRRSGD